MICIRLNGEPREIAVETSVAALLQELEIHGGAVAVEINRVIVPKSSYEERTLSAEDQVEVVTAVGGG